ncbi:MAG: hypothetical protein AAF512_21285, partial [Pseudomonadota bacterium]
GRDLPQKAMQIMHQQMRQDLTSAVKKTNAEVAYLLSSAKNGRVLQSNIMLKAISDRPFPYCVLNQWDHQIDEHNFISCYVTLWAQQTNDEQPIYVWLQLNPINPADNARLPADQQRTEPQIIRLPTGQADLDAFGTMISVMLHDIPSEAEASLQGKTLAEMITELKELRESLIRQKGQRGNFLHFVWTAYSQRQSQFVKISGLELHNDMR